jgi:uncharacterized membrane protein
MQIYINLYILEYCDILIIFDAVLSRFRKWIEVVFQFLLLMYSGGLYFNKAAIQSKQRRAEEE